MVKVIKSTKNIISSEKTVKITKKALILASVIAITMLCTG
jgi:hypothetical protein